MIDTFALGISHLLLLIAFWRLAQREDLQVDPEGLAEMPDISAPEQGEERSPHA